MAAIEVSNEPGKTAACSTGCPSLLGPTLLEKQGYTRTNLYHLCQALMWEPRGHKDMHGTLLVEKDAEDAHLAVPFIDNPGYGTMYGHAVIALGCYAIDYGLVQPVSPETEYDSESGHSGRVRFHSVPAFVFTVDQSIEVSGRGSVVHDIGYGGAFYALVSIHQFNLDLKSTAIDVLAQLADDITQATKRSVTLMHPESANLSFLYGTILTDGQDGGDTTTHISVFADGQVDCSPCGSGVTARVVVQYHKNQLELSDLSQNT